LRQNNHNWLSKALRRCIGFFARGWGRKAPALVTLVSQTGNVVLQVPPNTKPNRVDRRLWRISFGRFAWLLKTMGPLANSFHATTTLFAKCAWLKPVGEPRYINHKLQQRYVKKYLADVLYADGNNPCHQDRAQRLLMTMTNRALKLSEYGDTRLTTVVLKCRYEQGHPQSYIYLYSFSMDSLRCSELVELNIREQKFRVIVSWKKKD